MGSIISRWWWSSSGEDTYHETEDHGCYPLFMLSLLVPCFSSSSTSIGLLLASLSSIISIHIVRMVAVSEGPYLTFRLLLVPIQKIITGFQLCAVKLLGVEDPPPVSLLPLALAQGQLKSYD